MVVVGPMGRLFHIYDVWQMCMGGMELVQWHQNSLKFMTHVLGCMSDGKGMWGWLRVCMWGAGVCVCVQGM